MRDYWVLGAGCWVKPRTENREPSITHYALRIMLMTYDDVIRSLVCILAIDGEINQQENQFLQQIRKRLGVSPDVMKAAFEQAKQGKGSIHLSENAADLKQLLGLLVQATLADGKIDPQERQVLDAVAGKIGLSKADVELMLSAQLKRQAQQTRHQSQPGSAQVHRQQAAPIPVPHETASPSPESPSRHVCPKCGFEQQEGLQSCQRCGVIFRKYRSGSDEPDSSSSEQEESMTPTFSDPDDEGSAAAKLERMKQHSIKLKLWGGLVLLTVVFVIPLFLRLWYEEGSNRPLLLFGLVVLLSVAYGGAFLFTRFGVVTTGYVISKRFHRRRNTRSTGRSYHYEYLVRFEFEAAGKPYSSQASVNEFHYKRLAEGSTVKVRYLPIFPQICWLELW